MELTPQKLVLFAHGCFVLPLTLHARHWSVDHRGLPHYVIVFSALAGCSAGCDSERFLLLCTSNWCGSRLSDLAVNHAY